MYKIISEDQNEVINFEENYYAWIDHDSGLMWELKNKENVNYKYVWSKEYVKIADDIFYMNDDVKDIQSYVEKLNDISYVGYSDWRIPSIQELETLLVDDNLKKPLENNYLYACWSSNVYEPSENFSWYIDFNVGIKAYDEKINVYQVYCVRGKLNNEE